MNEIKQYLQDVAALECQANTQDRLISQINQQASSLGRRQFYQEPVLKTEYEFSPVALPCSFLIAMLLFFYRVYRITLLPKGALRNVPVVIALFQIFYPVFLGFPLLYFSYRALSKRRQKRHNMRVYKEELEKYNAFVKSDNLRVSQELAVMDDLKNQVYQVAQEKKRTLNALNQMYAIGIIHPKYRYLVAIASFYDYFDTGRCNTLVGPNGAYAIYEEELRFQRIESRLEVIISKLDEIINNQQYLGELMRDANDTLHRIDQTNNRMMKSMNRISENAELTAYNSSCSARSLSVMENISVYNFLRQQ